MLPNCPINSLGRNNFMVLMAGVFRSRVVEKYFAKNAEVFEI
jgi:hypothetical protein